MKIKRTNTREPEPVEREIPRIRVWTIGFLAILLALVGIQPPTYAGGTRQICNDDADFALGAEDYESAIHLHEKVLRQNPDDALAHYHLGFAYGMMGDHAAELREYIWAQRLGLNNWDFHLNFGLLRLQRSEYSEAITALTKAVALGPQHAETHFNLGLAYERAGQLQRAAEEVSLSLKLDPGQPDAENELAAIDAEMGNVEAARTIWTELLQADPGYQPALTNLAILHSKTSDPRQLGLALQGS